MKGRRKTLTESIHLQGVLYNRGLLLTYKGQRIQLPFGGLQIVTPICKPSPISFIVPPKRRPIRVDQQKSRIHVASIKRRPTREGQCRFPSKCRGLNLSAAICQFKQVQCKRSGTIVMSKPPALSRTCRNSHKLSSV